MVQAELDGADSHHRRAHNGPGDTPRIAGKLHDWIGGESVDPVATLRAAD